MWVMKLKVDSDKQFLGRMAIKHKVSMSGYPLSYYKDDKNVYLVICGLMFGSEKNKQEFFKDIMRQPELVKFEVNNDFSIGVIKQPMFTERFWDPRIIRLSPTIINCKEKKHTWELASFDKEILMKIYRNAMKYLGAEMIKLKAEKISNISITKVLPELTSRQKKALEIAINNGYYDYPKKVKMERLAKIMKVSYSTYQAHLKKAEGHIMPSVYKEL